MCQATTDGKSLCSGAKSPRHPAAHGEGARCAWPSGARPRLPPVPQLPVRGQPEGQAIQAHGGVPAQVPARGQPEPAGRLGAARQDTAGAPHEAAGAQLGGRRLPGHD